MSTEPTRRALRTTASAEEIRKLQAEHAVAVSERAELAARSVVRLFGKRAFGVPNTLLGVVQAPESRTLSARFTQWHYWWQAHFLDCAIDASLRAHRHLDSTKATEWFETAQKILRGIHTRNFNVWTNSYYDDMAWLALAAGRLNALSEVLNGRRRRTQDPRSLPPLQKATPTTGAAVCSGPPTKTLRTPPPQLLRRSLLPVATMQNQRRPC
ncbi:MAG: hypothetical protein Q3974_06360 [Rothia sp. (in: high G+C Gram-positive bacteria)]|nr:hypothetical protein [Rothia sp. (in: high G+C Gram-positive bacteria)]